MRVLFLPPVAFAIYLLLAAALMRTGPALGAPVRPSAAKSVLYASGERPDVDRAIPGYGPFFVIALFFAVVHLGVLVFATSTPGGAAALFLVGLMLVLLVLILG
jgi:NADH:ubiquinone oxidoreductase subunit 3 (subunit A)